MGSLRNAAWPIIALAALAYLTFAFIRAFETPDNMSAPTFGTAWAPYSDALGPWLEGGISFLFGLSPPPYLYRPTIGMFWGSILAMGGRVETIPIFFSLWLLALFAAMVLFNGERPMRNAVVAALGVCALRFPETWNLLYLATTNVDLPALVLTVSGLLLILSGRGPSAYPALLVGTACLGVAAAVRGPMMMAAPLILMVRVLLIERAPLKVILAVGVLFLTPLAIDVGLQRHLGIVNNGVVAIYCVYADPSHAWTAACHAQFLERKLGGLDVLQGFVRYLVSDEGRWNLHHRVSVRMAQDLASLHQVTTFAMFLLLGILASGNDSKGTDPKRRRLRSPFVMSAAVVATLALVRLDAGAHYWSALAWVLLALAAAALSRQWRAVLCLVGYVGGTLYLCMLGLHNDRLQNTFAFALFLGAALLAMADLPRDAIPEPGSSVVVQRALPAAIAVALLFLYVGSFVLPSQLRDSYRGEVQGRPDVALKLADDARIDRSLYYSGTRQIFYTKHDALEIGAVRRFKALATPMVSNASFVEPNAFVD